MKIWKRICLVSIVAVMIATLMALPVFAAWKYYFIINVTDTSGADRTYVPVMLGFGGSGIYSSGYMTATGTDTQMSLGTTNEPYMLSTTNVNTVLDTVPANSTSTLSFYTGYSPVQTAFPIVVGNNGYVTITDVAALEPAANFSFEYNGYLNATYAASKNLLYKEGAFKLYISALNTLKAEIYQFLSQYSSTSDGYVYQSDPVYNTAWAAVNGNVDDVATSVILGQKLDAGTYYVFRPCFYFDTSSIPGGATLLSATLYLYSTGIVPATNFDATIVNGQPVYPHTPLAAGDYDKTNYAGNGGSKNTASWTAGYNTISFNATGLTWINIGGTTKLMLRSSLDIAGTAPTGNEYLQIFTADEAGTSKDPYLEVVWDSGVSATGAVTSGVHTIKCYTSGGNLKIDQDAINIASSAMGAVTIPDTPHNWLIDQTNVMPYMTYYKHTVGGVEVVKYQPAAMITGTALPDLDVGDGIQNGVITWGANSGITITYGGVVPFISSSGVSIAASGGFTPPSVIEPPNWNASGGNINNPPADSIWVQIKQMLYDPTVSGGIPESSLGILLYLMFSIGLTVVTLVKTRSMFITVVVLVAMFAVGSSLTLIPGWLVFTVGIATISLLFLYRQYG